MSYSKVSELTSLGDKELTALRTKFGFVFQGAALFDSMTIADNVAFPLRENRTDADRGDRENHRMSGWRRSGCRQSVLGKRPAQLSGGMRKRVGLAAGTGDEPGSGALRRADHRARPDHERRDQRADHPHAEAEPVTSIVVTHDMKTAQKVADRVVMLYPLSRLKHDESQIIFDGTPQRNYRVEGQTRRPIRPRRSG